MLSVKGLVDICCWWSTRVRGGAVSAGLRPHRSAIRPVAVETC